MWLKPGIFFLTGLFLLHSVAEYATSFYATDQSIQWLSGLLGTVPVVAWLLAQLLLFGYLALLYQLSSQKVLWLALLVIIAFELSHVVLAVRHGAYYPGVFTAVLILPFAWLPYSALFRRH